MSPIVLHIDCSVNFQNSKSRTASKKVVDALNPTKVIRRDLAAEPLPFIDNAWVNAGLIEPQSRTTNDKSILTLSDTLISELRHADIIVIGHPMYNLGVPASLKAWIDLIVRLHETFVETESGLRGLLENKRAIIVAASDGTKIGSGVDFASRHLVACMNFIGIDDVSVIDANTLE